MEPVKQFQEVPSNITMEGYSVTIKYYESLKHQSPNSYTERTVFLALSEGYQAYLLKQVLIQDKSPQKNDSLGVHVPELFVRRETGFSKSNKDLASAFLHTLILS